MKFSSKLDHFFIITLIIAFQFCFIDARRSRKKIRLRGPPGMPGRPGPKGERGWIGSPGKSGNFGEQGPLGERGNQGVQGKYGMKGVQGQMGADGGTGPAGPPVVCPSYYKRIDCAVGQPGLPGSHGKTGGKGIIGPTGHKGERGAKGATGVDGKRGRSGRPGSVGLLTEMKCRTAKTRYVRPLRFKNGRHSFECSEANIEFLKGFEIETRGEKIRYKYKCCWFINVFK